MHFNKSKHLSEIVLELPDGRAAVHEKRKAFSGSFAKTIKHLSVEFEEEEKGDEKRLKNCCKMNEYLLKMTPESSYDLSEGKLRKYTLFFENHNTTIFYDRKYFLLIDLIE